MQQSGTHAASAPQVCSPRSTVRRSPKIRMRPGPATRTASDACSCATFVTARRRNDAAAYQRFAPLRAQCAAFSPKPSTVFRHLAMAALSCGGGQRPIPALASGRRRPQLPGQTRTRLRAFPVCPPAIHPRENRRLPLALRDHSAASGTATFSLNPLSGSLLRPAIEKLRPLVQKLWTFGLPCGTRRKSKKDSAPRSLPPTAASPPTAQPVLSAAEGTR
jgi:hypothetical protein